MSLPGVTEQHCALNGPFLCLNGSRGTESLNALGSCENLWLCSRFRSSRSRLEVNTHIWPVSGTDNIYLSVADADFMLLFSCGSHTHTDNTKLWKLLELSASLIFRHLTAVHLVLDVDYSWVALRNILNKWFHADSKAQRSYSCNGYILSLIDTRRII